MLKIHSTAYNNGIHLQLAGSVNGRSYTELANSFNLQIQRNPAFIVVNFTDIKIVTSIGLKVIFDTYRQLGATYPLKLCGLNQDIHQLITLTGMSRLIPIYKDFNSAMLSLSKDDNPI